MMTTSHSLIKTQALQQMTQLIKTDGCIGGSAEEPLKRLLSSLTDILPSGAGRRSGRIWRCATGSRIAPSSPNDFTPSHGCSDHPSRGEASRLCTSSRRHTHSAQAIPAGSAHFHGTAFHEIYPVVGR